jgi:tubulin-folding cofactor B
VINIDDKDPEYLSELASSIGIGSRCKLGSGARGEVKFVGKIMDLGQGFFVGVKLDEPFGNSNGVVNGVKYFEASDKFAIFVRPNALEIGDFPELDIDDEI